MEEVGQKSGPGEICGRDVIFLTVVWICPNFFYL